MPPPPEPPPPDAPAKVNLMIGLIVAGILTLAVIGTFAEIGGPLKDGTAASFVCPLEDPGCQAVGPGQIGICHALEPGFNRYVFLVVTENGTEWQEHASHPRDVIAVNSPADCPGDVVVPTARTPLPTPPAKTMPSSSTMTTTQTTPSSSPSPSTPPAPTTSSTPSTSTSTTSTPSSTSTTNSSTTNATSPSPPPTTSPTPTTTDPTPTTTSPTPTETTPTSSTEPTPTTSPPPTTTSEPPPTDNSTAPPP